MNEYFEELYQRCPYEMHHTKDARNAIFSSICTPHISSRANALDIGIGANRFIQELGFKNLYATDIHTDFVYACLVEDIECIKHDAHDGIPPILKQRYYDFIVCSEVLEHLLDGRKLLKDIKNSLQRNGILFITVPNEQGFFYNRLQILLKGTIRTPNTPIYDEQHLRFFDKVSLKELLESEGFEIIELSGYNQTIPDSLMGLLLAPPFKDTLARWFPSLFATNFYAVARVKHDS